jgi:hypothetical protein
VTPTKLFPAAVVVGLVALLACGGSSNNSGAGGAPGPFPFTGPSCPPGTQATLMQQTGACEQCLESHCDQSCVVADCSDYATCACACAKGDTSCQQGCSGKLTTTCASCFAGIEACLLQSCAATCYGGLLDAGQG